MRTALYPVVMSACSLWAGLAGAAEPGVRARDRAERPAERGPDLHLLPQEDLPRLRPVLKGALYRSGTPSEAALSFLCESGWKRVYSLYGEHTTQTGPRNANMLRHGKDQRQCAASDGSRTLEWRSAPSSRMRTLPHVFKDILDSIRNPEKGPVLVHCWNGLHYAGMVSALALRQFCGLSGEQAEAYWRANANRGANYPLIIANFYSFKPIPELSLTPEEQQAVCPDLSKTMLVSAEAFLPRPGPTLASERSGTPSVDGGSGASALSGQRIIPVGLGAEPDASLRNPSFGTPPATNRLPATVGKPGSPDAALSRPGPGVTPPSPGSPHTVEPSAPASRPLAAPRSRRSSASATAIPPLISPIPESG